jgi:membrane-associated phospholipid phosphatase
MKKYIHGEQVMKKKNIINIILFTIIFAGLLLIATLYDKQISDILAKPYLENGQFYSTNTFGRIFEVIGEMPLYLFIVGACSILVVNCSKIKNKPLKFATIILFMLVGIGFGFYGYNKLFKYIGKLYPTITLNKNILFNIFLIILSIVQQLLLSLLLYKKAFKLSEKLLKFAIIVLFAAACSQIIIHIIKPIFARERYRASYVLEFNNIQSIGFTKWYTINGDAKEIADSLGVEKTYFTSFPSGHTGCAGIVYTLMFLPFYIEKLNNKKGKIICIIILSRISIFNIRNFRIYSTYTTTIC